MIENVFYRVPKELGYYDDNNNYDSIDSEPWYVLPPKRRFWDEDAGEYRDHLEDIIQKSNDKDDKFKLVK